MNIKTAAAAAVFFSVAATYPAQESTRSVWQGVYSEEQEKRGAAAYALECAMCHGHDLQGGEEAPALFGGGFMSNWSGLTAGDLSERIRISMPPDDPSRLTRQQNVDIISVIFKANGFPAASKELDPQLGLLKQIRIENRQ